MEDQDVYTGIIANRPGEPFVWTADGGLDWQAETDPPSEAEIEAWATAAKAERESEQTNETALRDRADQAVGTLENAVAGWANLTAAQKDGAIKLAIRVVIALARLRLAKFDSPGV